MSRRRSTSSSAAHPSISCSSPVAGTEGANRAFGVDLTLLREGNEAGRSSGRGTVGDNVMYLEPARGRRCRRELTGHRRSVRWTSSARGPRVRGGAGPAAVAGEHRGRFHRSRIPLRRKANRAGGARGSVLRKAPRAADGVDVCYTNHAEADQDDMDTLLTLLAVAGTAFVITVPGADDVMLGYQSLSFHDALYVREVARLRPAPEFEAWLRKLGMADDTGRIPSRRRRGVAVARPRRRRMIDPWDDIRRHNRARIGLGQRERSADPPSPPVRRRPRGGAGRGAQRRSTSRRCGTDPRCRHRGPADRAECAADRATYLRRTRSRPHPESGTKLPPNASDHRNRTV